MNDFGLLLVCAKNGNQSAYGEIVHDFQDMAVGYVYALLGDMYLAEAAAQEAFIEAWRYLPKYMVRPPFQAGSAPSSSSSVTA